MAHVQDLFPAVDSVASKDEQLRAALASAAITADLQPTNALLDKSEQLHSTMAGRFGTMLVGPAASGKTTAYRTLAQARNNTAPSALVATEADAVHVRVMNPKALTLDELYGSHNALTGEWKDGLAAHIFRDALAGSSADAAAERWVVFDGPVDALWVESLNTVLDDSCMLCLPSGERMKLDRAGMRVLFEVEDLTAASPATVSRCGMVYVPDAPPAAPKQDSKAAPVDPIFASWLQKLPDVLNLPQESPAALASSGSLSAPPRGGSAAASAAAGAGLMQNLRTLFDKYVPAGLAWLEEHAVEPVPQVPRQRTAALCAWLQMLLQSSVDTLGLREGYAAPARVAAEYMFAFAFVWGLGGALDAGSRGGWDKRVRALFNGVANFPPGSGTVYDFCCNPERNFTFQVRFSERVSSAP